MTDDAPSSGIDAWAPKVGGPTLAASSRGSDKSINVDGDDAGGSLSEDGSTAADKSGSDDESPTKSTRDTVVQPETEEIGGPKGPEPTRFGDWEKGGRCSDF